VVVSRPAIVPMVAGVHVAVDVTGLARLVQVFELALDEQRAATDDQSEDEQSPNQVNP
jgi:hypothetical protein